MKVTTEKGARIKIREACKGVGTYREEFEDMIEMLAELWIRREATKDEFRKSGGRAIIKQTNKGGNSYAAKNPLLGKKPQPADDPLALALGELKLLKNTGS